MSSNLPQFSTTAPRDAFRESGQSATAPEPGAAPRKKRGSRGGKKRKGRKQSFAAGTAESGGMAQASSGDGALSPLEETPRTSFYGSAPPRRLSESSLESEALLDHRGQQPMRPRRDSRAGLLDMGSSYRPAFSRSGQLSQARRKSSDHVNDDENKDDIDSRTPLLRERRGSGHTPSGYGVFKSLSIGNTQRSNRRSGSTGTSRSSMRRRPLAARENSAVLTPYPEYDVNNPPSVPPSPKMRQENDLDDLMLNDPFADTTSGDPRPPSSGDHLIDIDGDAGVSKHSTPPTPRLLDQRRHTIPFPSAEEDVCFPVEGMSELAEDDFLSTGRPRDQSRPRRKRARQWPDLSVLDEWSRDEKEERSEGRRAKTISEPVLVGGRLRPHKNHWHREEEDVPYRFTYFNEELESTIHSQTISELPQPGQTFRELFIPDPPELSDESSDEEEQVPRESILSPYGLSKTGTRQSSIIGDPPRSSQPSASATPPNGQPQAQTPALTERPKRYGPRPTFWLDVLSPTEAEMKVIQRTFGIHPLTAEDILMQEAREKVELFRNYYFVNYRTFEQDSNSIDYLEPVDMYIVVFRDGVISFHFSMTPHPANVRRRVRQLKDYLVLTADWISYALIDDITDVFAPLIQSIEEEVDEIDDEILQLHMSNDSASESPKKEKDPEKRSDTGETTVASQGDMLRRVGQGRKKVMGLYRLLGNKADVIKGFAKRCNEQWEVAPRSEIGLYLGDIQDHILTMTSNLNHYETLLSRAHSNYLAQINIRMNERQEQTSDILGKLTVLGTIVLPMNIITGMWGMNVLVPGQDIENLYWFWSITTGLVIFGVSCFFIAKRVYGIV